MNLRYHHLTALFEERYIDRGKVYLKEGLVEIVHSSDSSIRSRCAGTSLYNIELILAGDKLDGRCSCPAFGEFGPCKHMAATTLATIAQKEGGYRTSDANRQRKQQFDALERHLKRMTKAQLIALVIEHLGEDEEFLWSILDPEDDRS